jgi:hypothetical protein
MIRPRTLNLVPILGGVCDHLSQFGVKPDVVARKRVSLGEVRRAEQSLGGAIPEPLREIYLGFGNGLSFSWALPDEEDMHGCLEIPSLGDLVLSAINWRDYVVSFQDDGVALDNDVETEKAAFERMASWIPFWEEGNGDILCIDFGIRRAPIAMVRAALIRDDSEQDSLIVVLPIRLGIASTFAGAVFFGTIGIHADITFRPEIAICAAIGAFAAGSFAWLLHRGT